jgi:hypothetical protein
LKKSNANIAIRYLQAKYPDEYNRKIFKKAYLAFIKNFNEKEKQRNKNEEDEKEKEYKKEELNEKEGENDEKLEKVKNKAFFLLFN